MINEFITCIGGLLAVLGIATIVLSISGLVNDDKPIFKKHVQIPVLLGAIVLIILGNSFVIIPTGYSGVRITAGQIDETTMPTGFNWKIPFIQTVTQISNKQQDITFEDQIWGETTNRTAIYYDDVTVTYQIEDNASAWIVANVEDYQDGLVTADIVTSAIKASSKTLEDDDATNRSIVEPLIEENLQLALDQKYGEGVIQVKMVTIADIDFEDSYKESIAAKQQAQLEAEEQEIINEKEIAMAQAEYDVAIIEAQAEADAAVIKAEGEAEANAVIAESLTDEILEEMYIEQWDGELPDVVSADGATDYLIDLGGYGDGDDESE